MTKAVAGKLGLNPGMRALIIAPPPGYLNVLGRLPEEFEMPSKTGAAYPFVQIFATRLSDISKFAKKLNRFAAPNALVWVSYPKQTSKLKGDLSRDVIREALNGWGWRAVSIVAIDETWSSLRFRPAGQVGSRSKRGAD